MNIAFEQTEEYVRGGLTNMSSGETTAGRRRVLRVQCPCFSSPYISVAKRPVSSKPSVCFLRARFPSWAPFCVQRDSPLRVYYRSTSKQPSSNCLAVPAYELPAAAARWSVALGASRLIPPRPLGFRKRVPLTAVAVRRPGLISFAKNPVLHGLAMQASRRGCSKSGSSFCGL
ncbi:MAG: hypothetical protein BJ554DRAFT_3018 [Olpidium bornovanus]|uniref:Uncharacterized protein n=1 Tax=Olpidium bornovanus TaxID=278681 RepID=A0A8H8A2J7_9FUNG|nr:MAG: hypothetical protein BJ554DRAFT_3018 [Olpidium bornovanus]KAG5463737.1 MAG: hypothetical protein BJ554DRAFT_3018 [Olpidium bornovanus]